MVTLSSASTSSTGGGFLVASLAGLLDMKSGATRCPNTHQARSLLDALAVRFPALGVCCSWQHCVYRRGDRSLRIVSAWQVRPKMVYESMLEPLEAICGATMYPSISVAAMRKVSGPCLGQMDSLPSVISGKSFACDCSNGPNLQQGAREIFRLPNGNYLNQRH